MVFHVKRTKDVSEKGNKALQPRCGLSLCHVPYDDKSHDFKPSQEYHSLNGCWSIGAWATGTHCIHEYNFGGFYLVFTWEVWLIYGSHPAVSGSLGEEGSPAIPARSCREFMCSLFWGELALRNVIFLLSLSLSQGSPGVMEEQVKKPGALYWSELISP